MHIPSQEGNIKHSFSTQADLGYPIYNKKRLRDDPEDKWDFRHSSPEEDSFIHLPSSKRSCAPSTASYETPVATDNRQVSRAPSVSVQKTTEHSTSNQKTVQPCQFTQGLLECSITSQDTQRPSLAVPKCLQCSASDPGLQRHASCLSGLPEISSKAQGTLLLSKYDVKSVKPFVSAKGSEAKPHWYKNLQNLCH